MARDERINALHAALARRVVMLDGAMGSMIQRYELGEDAFRGSAFANHRQPLQGANDLLSLTQPDIIYAIHKAYAEAGADILETNTFGANAPALEDFGLEAHCYDINLAAAQVARKAADEVADADGRHRLVAGALGPTTRTASLSPDVNDPGARNITFDELVATYAEATHGLLDGGSDVLLVETIFDTLNAKAALYAIDRVLEERGECPANGVRDDHRRTGGRCPARPPKRSGTRCATHSRCRSDSTVRWGQTSLAVRRRGRQRGRCRGLRLPERRPPNEFGQYDDSEAMATQSASGHAADSSTSSEVAAAVPPPTSRPSPRPSGT